MAYRFIVVGDDGVDLDMVANQLREQISSLPPDKPQLAKQALKQPAAGVLEALLVVRGHENPHTHPNADLIFTVLEGGGWLQRSPTPNPETNIEVMAGTTVVVPRGMCHAFHNTSGTDSVLLVTFSFTPPDPTAAAECPQNS
ncbi:MAG TPA: cupin domain-containing protein [Pyrinomonadaceae bacterium]|jgi:oxalate decarboxylase/phosphoglucose isomerase-like protein (cupin superfamily)